MVDKINDNNIQGGNPQNVKRQYLLEQNPFLVTENLQKKELNIKLIDEFTIEYQGNRIPLYLFIETNQYRLGKKRKILKRNLKKWKKEYLAKETAFMANLRNEEIATDHKKVNRFSIYTWIIYCFIFIAVLLLFFHYQIFSTTPVFHNFLLKVHEVVKLEIGQYLLVAFTLSLFFVLNYGIYQNAILYFYKRKFRKSRKTLNNSALRTKGEFRKKFSRIKKHYLARLKKPSLRPLTVDKLMSLESRFDQLELLSDETIANASVFVKNNRSFKIKRLLMHGLVILLGTALLIFIAIEML